MTRSHPRCKYLGRSCAGPEATPTLSPRRGIAGDRPPPPPCPSLARSDLVADNRWWDSTGSEALRASGLPRVLLEEGGRGGAGPAARERGLGVGGPARQRGMGRTKGQR